MKSFLASILLAAFAVGFVPTVYAQEAAPGTGMNYETRLSALEDAIRALNGQVEQLTYAIRRLDQSTQRLQSDYDGRILRLEAVAQQASAPAPAPAAPLQPSVSVNPAAIAPEAPVNGTLGALKMQDGHVTGGVISPQSPPLPETPADYGLTPQEQYDRAFGLLRQANYEEAETAFKNFIDKNPKDKLTDNAKYWYAETLYVRGRFPDSALAFADAYQQNPQGQKAPDSLLKLAMSLANTSKTQDACTALTQLRNNYPNASANVRSRASEERAKLKCGAP
jgi:tol-pal system protein YbgF